MLRGEFAAEPFEAIAESTGETPLGPVVSVVVVGIGFELQAVNNGHSAIRNIPQRVLEDLIGLSFLD